MHAVHLIGHGGYEKLHYVKDAKVPVPASGEVLIHVLAAGVNNTDINTRLGWYSSDVTAATDQTNTTNDVPAVGDWSGAGLDFPLIQGADVCGTVVAVGPETSPHLMNKRVIVQSCLLSQAQGAFTPFLGSERNGAFAQYVTAPLADTYAVESNLSDAQLAAIPCAYGTAENLLVRAALRAGETVLIAGASGNVGIALVQLAKRRGAQIIAVASASKHEAIIAIGANRCIEAGALAGNVIVPNSIDVVIDVVGGPQWPKLLELLKPRGRYACSGAIAGPIVSFDLRKLYLKDLSFFGCTSQEPQVFPNLVSYIDNGEITPLISATYPLSDIVAAQQTFVSKRQVGKIVLVPGRD